jgi:NitT/TauT family transport system permease protein
MIAWIYTGLALIFANAAVLNLDTWLAPPLAGLALGACVIALRHLSRDNSRAARIAAPVLFGAFILWGWQMLVVGFHVPFILLPPPTAIATALLSHSGELAGDFDQTFMHAVLAGYTIGCGSGFLIALAIDRSPFLQRGLTPFGNMVSAMPVIGIAPIAVEWFGFDWPSKAAVVTLMTVFPMLVNTQAGLQSASVMERDLMRSYGAPYWKTLFKLRLPAAMPMIFNALKLNSTLALIGAVVAEFFASPTRGMGFRISTESARMNLDIVWATIAIAAIAGSCSFALIAGVERIVTFWHPSFHKRLEQ